MKRVRRAGTGGCAVTSGTGEGAEFTVQSAFRKWTRSVSQIFLLAKVTAALCTEYVSEIVSDKYFL